MQQPTFGRRVKALRLARGLSQAAVAGPVMSTGYLSRIEGGTRPPTARIIEHLAKQLGVTPVAFSTPVVLSLGRVLAAVTSAAPSPTEVGSQPMEADGSHSGDAVERVTSALRDADDRWDPALRWQALWFLANVHGTRGDAEEEQTLLTELSALADELEAPELQARARTRLARSSRIAGEYAAAREQAMAALSVAANLDVADRAAALQELVSAEAEAGRLADARGHVDELCEWTQAIGGSLHVSALWSAATVRVRQADYHGARGVLERALGLVDGHRDPLLWLRLHLAAASSYLQVDPPATAEARECVEKVGPVVESLGSEVHRQQMLAVQAHLAFEEDEVEEARGWYAQLVERPLLLSFRDRVRFQALGHQLQILDGRTDEGVHGLQVLGEQAQEAMNPELAAEVWRSLARSLAAGRSRRPGGTAVGSLPV